MPGRTNEGKAETNRAAIYARVSDKSQDGEDKTSIAEQMGDMEAYCERKGLTITARYQEVGNGGRRTRLRRPDLSWRSPDGQVGLIMHRPIIAELQRAICR